MSNINFCPNCGHDLVQYSNNSEDSTGSYDNETIVKAVEVVIASNKASTSLLQRKLRIGYGKSARLMEIMEDRGYIGPAKGSEPRDVLIDSIDQM